MEQKEKIPETIFSPITLGLSAKTKLKEFPKKYKYGDYLLDKKWKEDYFNKKKIEKEEREAE